MKLTRREVLKLGGWAGLALGCNALAPALFRRRLMAEPTKGEKKLIFIFQRGGSDGVNTLIPRGDPEYSLVNRPTLFIPESSALVLGDGFAQLHPAMAPMMEVYNNESLNGVTGPGNLAVLHRIGYGSQSRSHFDSQHYWETGVPGEPSFEEGMLYRHVAETMDLENNRLAAAALSSSQLLALKGPRPIPTIPNVTSFKFAGDEAAVAKFLGKLPSQAQGTDGAGMLGLYGGERDASGKPYRDLVFGTGLALADAMQIVQAAVAQGDYTPANGAQYPDGTFGRRLEEIAMLFKRTPARVLGVNLGGWDTHTNQGQIGGNHGRLLSSVAQAFQAFYRDLADQWEDILIVTMTEFGRTSKENASKGTDHAQACVMFVAGGSVNGGVYNCDAATWAAGDMFSVNDRYVRERTDYRTVFAEIFTRHFGDSEAILGTVIPGYTAAAAARPEAFTPLGFLPA